ncbi:30S ribosomal protein S6 [Candidatus Nomurabacteria bacterium]|nr:30S ribosomal protein S6 [Candidatus Nomurabacteria bacterium]
MSETTMPAAEAEVLVDGSDEQFSYELAFHVLPTVAEGEVTTVFADIKALITNDSGHIFDEEAPERFDLAYEIEKVIEGKHRKFASAYFGWVRFKAEAEAVLKITAEIESRPDILRHLLIKLTRTEEENPFRFHEAIKDQKMVSTVEESEVLPDVTTVTHSDDEDAGTEDEDAGEVDEEAIDKALEEKEV